MSHNNNRDPYRRRPWPSPLLALLALLLLPLAALAQLRMELIELQHRSGQELLPLLLPLLAPQGGASAYENKLVIRATPEQAHEVRALIARLDQPPRELLISLRHGATVEDAAQAVGIGSEAGELHVRAQARQQQDAFAGIQQLRVAEGQEARLQMGSTAPQYRRQRLPDGTVIEYREHSGGALLTVLPRLQGERVQLELSTRGTSAGGDGGSIQTVVSVPLGQWVEIGSAVQQLQQGASGILQHNDHALASAGRLWLRVEALR